MLLKSQTHSNVLTRFLWWMLVRFARIWSSFQPKLYIYEWGGLQTMLYWLQTWRKYILYTANIEWKAFNMSNLFPCRSCVLVVEASQHTSTLAANQCNVHFFFCFSGNLTCNLGLLHKGCGWLQKSLNIPGVVLRFGLVWSGRKLVYILVAISFVMTRENWGWDL